MGINPVSQYTAKGHDLTKQLGLEDERYVHHVSMSNNNLVLVTDKKLYSILHNTRKTSLKINWSLMINDINNLPHIEEGKLLISLDSRDESVMIECDNIDKLRSIKLGLEYSVLLTMPFKCSNYSSRLVVDSSVC